MDNKVISIVLTCLIHNIVNATNSFQKAKIFKIVDKNNEVTLEKDLNQAYDHDELLKFLVNNADLELRINNEVIKHHEEGKSRKGLKRALVKRKIPHGIETPSVEYDHNYKTYYRPLVRLHKTKKTNEDESKYTNKSNKSNFLVQSNSEFKDGTNEVLLQPFKLSEYDNGNQKDKHHKSRLEKDPVSLLKLLNVESSVDTKKYKKGNQKHKAHSKASLEDDELKALLTPLMSSVDAKYKKGDQQFHKKDAIDKTKNVEYLYNLSNILSLVKRLKYENSLSREYFKKETDLKSALRIIRSIKKLSKTVKSPFLRKMLLNAVMKFLKKVRLLRTVEQVKSGEHNDPMAPANTLEEIVYEEKPSIFYPHQPLWNAWTYKKTIHEDGCPKGQVKIGNVCSWIPPH